jgi:pimeloyl-ACP methyl ester carboxylesterase
MTNQPPAPDELKTALIRLDTESEPGVVVTPRYRMRYFTWGPASGRPPVVFVHGMADRARSFAMVMARLANAGFRCVGIELASGRGDGANLGMYRHRHFAADLLVLVDHLGIGRADLFGSSFGSTVVLRTAISCPDRVRRVVLQGGFARRPLARWERGLSRLGRYWPWLMRDLPFRVAEMNRLEARHFRTSPPEVMRFLLDNSGGTPCRAAALRTLMLDRLDLRPYLSAVRCPVLMLGGDGDSIVPRQYEAEVEAGLPDVRRVEFAGCGHYPQYTRPAGSAAAVVGFLGPP